MEYFLSKTHLELIIYYNHILHILLYYHYYFILIKINIVLYFLSIF